MTFGVNSRAEWSGSDDGACSDDSRTRLLQCLALNSEKIRRELELLAVIRHDGGGPRTVCV